ncbi:type III secretion system translocon subunit SctE [Glaciimonas sp. PAMC28666]|uniref:type III secretion system translocon subunit SctE n=1 Tax=Glaciimonas sp. PAMC28666 TaxID=2807626 RepID=UPI00196360B9|nr:type III secretion system translocon subunit SctE [Glaciimonas sp. PAMC28666]QRX82147.1 type III secretion system translocon subunit SctE [Glaciimonas sp. PAMC28666]
MPEKASVDEKGGSTKVEVRLAALMAALERGNVSKLAASAHAFFLQQEMRNSANRELAEKYEAALLAVEQSTIDLVAISGQLDAVIEAIEILEKQLSDAELALSSAEVGTPEYDAALEKRDALQETISGKQVQVADLRVAAISLEATVLDRQAQVAALGAQCEHAGISLPESLQKKDQTNIARMLSLMTKLGELMLKTGEARAEAQRALFRVQEDMRTQKMVAEAEKSEREMAKAQALNKAMGCVGKILGAVITAVAVVGAAFTGGASLALAGIGVALMVADEVYGAVTGKSFMQDAMQPLMKVLQPVLQFFMDKVSAMLEDLGVDAQTSKMVSMIVVSVAIAVAAVAIAATGAGSAVASAISNITSKIGAVMSRVLEKVIAKLVPAVLKKAISQAAKQLSSAASRLFDAASQRLGMSTDLASKQIYANRMMMLSFGLNFEKTVITSGLDVGAEVANLKVAKANAKIQFGSRELELLNDMIAALMEQFQNSFNVSQRFSTAASDALMHHTSTGVALARAIRGAHSA